MRWIYVIAVVSILLWTTSNAIVTLNQGYETLALVMGLAAFAWVSLCTLALRWSSRAKLGALTKIAARTILGVLATVGTVFGHLVGGLSTLGFSYGNAESEIVSNYPIAFGLGLVGALTLGLVLAAIATLPTILKRLNASAKETSHA